MLSRAVEATTTSVRQPCRQRTKLRSGVVASMSRKSRRLPIGHVHRPLQAERSASERATVLVSLQNSTLLTQHLEELTHVLDAPHRELAVCTPPLVKSCRLYRLSSEMAISTALRPPARFRPTRTRR